VARRYERIRQYRIDREVAECARFTADPPSRTSRIINIGRWQMDGERAGGVDMG
jgi:hypothetical protein